MHFCGSIVNVKNSFELSKRGKQSGFSYKIYMKYVRVCISLAFDLRLESILCLHFFSFFKYQFDAIGNFSDRNLTNTSVKLKQIF